MNRANENRKERNYKRAVSRRNKSGRFSYAYFNKEEKKIERKASDLFKYGKFDELEEMAAELRASKSRTAEGRLKLIYFYSDLGSYVNRVYSGEREPPSPIKQAKVWLSAKPNSVTAHTAFARLLIKKAWKARGGGYANTVSKDGWSNFHKYLKQAKVVLERAEMLQEKDPIMYNDFASVGRGLSVSKEQRVAWMKRGLLINPHYYTLYQSEAGTRLPRWGGSADDVARFALSASESLGGQEGLIAYFWIVDRIKRYFGYSLVSAGKPIAFDKSRFHKSLRVLLDRYPCAENYARVSKYAVALKDMELAQKCFNELGNQYPVEYYRSKSSFLLWRKWALDGGVWPLER